MTRPHLEPSTDHPITVEPTGSNVAVRAGQQEIARSNRALTLREADYPAVQYIPLDDVDQSLLRPTDTSTYCPFKGDASYYSVVTPDGELTDAVWGYRTPYPAVAQIAGHVAFYPNKVTVTVADD